MLAMFTMHCFNLSRLLSVVCFLVFVTFNSLEAKFVSTEIQYALLIDDATGQILYRHRDQERMFPSSMSKIMTLYTAFALMQERNIPLDRHFFVSEKAHKMQGSKMFLALNSYVKISDLIKGIIIQSANDACVVLAEGLLGAEVDFVQQMNIMAKKLNMDGTHFENSSGLPNLNHYTTAKDMIILMRAFMRDFPQYYHINKEESFKYNDILQYNRNTLLGYYGADGIKTGHTDIAGYSIAFSALHDNIRVLGVINGLKSISTRTATGKKLLHYAYSIVDRKALYSKEQNIVEIDSYYGSLPKVAVGPEYDVVVFQEKELNSKNPKVDIVLKNKLIGEVAKGDVVGKMLVHGEYIQGEVMEVPLIALSDVKKATFTERILQNILLIFS